MNAHPELPPHQRKDSECNGEPVVHDQFPDGDLLSDALHEVKPPPEAPELRFEVWIESMGRFGIEVKRGTYSVPGVV